MRQNKLFQFKVANKILVNGRKYDSNSVKCLMRESREEFAFTRIFTIRYSKYYLYGVDVFAYKYYQTSQKSVCLNVQSKRYINGKY